MIGGGGPILGTRPSFWSASVLEGKGQAEGLSFIEEKTSHVMGAGSHVTLERWGVPPLPPPPSALSGTPAGPFHVTREGETIN